MIPEPIPPALQRPLSPLEPGLESAHFPTLPRQSPPLESLGPSHAGEASPNPWKAGSPEIPKSICVQGSVEVLQLLHGGLAFRFSSIDDRDKVLENGIFYVGGQPIFIRQWERNLHTGGMLGLKRIPLWVTLPGLPLHLWGEESLSIICSVLGNPLFLDSTTALKSRWVFARVCIEFVGDKPLLDVVTIEDDEGNEFLQQVKYEWRPPQCLSCGVFGHAHDSCKKVCGAGLEEKEVGKNTIESDLKVMENVADESVISTLLQNRNSTNLHGRKHLRVRKMNPAGLDPTHSKGQMKTSLAHAESPQAPGHVSRPEGSLSGPLPNPAECLLENAEKSDPTPLFRQSFLNPPGTTSFPPPLANRFDCLEDDADRSSLEPSAAISNSAEITRMILDVDPTLDPSPSQPSNHMPLLAPSHSQPLNHGLSPRARSSIQNRPQQKKTKTQSSCCGLDQNSSTPSTPKSGPISDEPRVSSIGHTPYPNNISRFSRSKHKNIQAFPLIPGPIFNSARKNYRSFSSELLQPRIPPAILTPPGISQNAVEGGEEDECLAEDAKRKWEEERNKAQIRPLDQNSTIGVIESWEDLEVSLGDSDKIFHNAADGKAEDIEEEVNEENVGTEEDVDEDYEEEKEKDNQLEREDAVEETDRRKKLTNSGRYDDLWVTTTNLNDPRRINFW